MSLGQKRLELNSIIMQVNTNVVITNVLRAKTPAPDIIPLSIFKSNYFRLVIIILKIIRTYSIRTNCFRPNVIRTKPPASGIVGLSIIR